MTLLKYLAFFSVMASLAVFAAGCGGNEVTPENDPVTSDDNDPALAGANPDETSGAESDDAKTDDAK